jgi:hypothetical protein
MMIWRIFYPWRNEIACDWGCVACWLTDELYIGICGEKRGTISTLEAQAQIG